MVNNIVVNESRFRLHASRLFIFRFGFWHKVLPRERFFGTRGNLVILAEPVERVCTEGQGGTFCGALEPIRDGCILFLMQRSSLTRCEWRDRRSVHALFRAFWFILFRWQIGKR